MEDIELSEAARALFEAPFGVLSHSLHSDGPPTFVYANQASRPRNVGLWGTGSID